ncbi:MAG TPA: hypothetical protein PLN91_07560 [Rhodanobacteraceae bacterium]|nr:hypothetical protein [Rhodanobacteraceae bacterium]
MRRGWWVLLVVVALALAACARAPAEQRLRDTVAAMQAAVEAREPRDFLRHVSADFTGNAGQVDREGLHNLLRAVVLRNERIGVVLGPPDIELSGDRARLRLRVTLTGSAGGLIPERGAVYAIDSGWKQEGDAWRCISASWEQVL